MNQLRNRKLLLNFFLAVFAAALLFSFCHDHENECVTGAGDDCQLCLFHHAVEVSLPLVLLSLLAYISADKLVYKFLVTFAGVLLSSFVRLRAPPAFSF